MKRRFLFLSALLGAMFLLLGSALATDLASPLAPPEAEDLMPQVGDDAPAFSLRAYNEDAALRLLKSPMVALSSMVGLGAEHPKKVVLLGFFACWNEKSLKDLAVFQRLFKKFKDSGVMVVMISVDNKDTQVLYETIDRDKLGYPILRDRFGVVSRRYGVTKLPTLFVLDKDGKVMSVGAAYQEDLESYLEGEIRSMLKM